MTDPTLAERIAALRAEVHALWVVAHAERAIAQIAREKADTVWLVTAEVSQNLCSEIYRLEAGS